MGDEVLALGTWANNAALIADVARLGYLDGEVLDLTYGKGRFWRVHTPALFVTNDLHRSDVDLSHDYRCLPMPDRWCDVVVFDPPYRLSGRRDRGERDESYGTTVRRNRTSTLDDIVSGALEGFRVCRRHLLVKCQDMVEGGRPRWQTRLVAEAIEAAGGIHVDWFILPTRPVEQPAGRVQRRARRYYSSLLVFERPKRLR